MPPLKVDLTLFGDHGIQAARLDTPGEHLGTSSAWNIKCSSPPGYLTHATRHGRALLLLQHEVVKHKLGVQPLAVRELHQPLRVPGQSQSEVIL